ncbi:hypothetical protein Tco_1321389 [Tanacetum coccineum]
MTKPIPFPLFIANFFMRGYVKWWWMFPDSSCHKIHNHNAFKLDAQHKVIMKSSSTSSKTSANTTIPHIILDLVQRVKVKTFQERSNTKAFQNDAQYHNVKYKFQEQAQSEVNDPLQHIQKKIRVRAKDKDKAYSICGNYERRVVAHPEDGVGMGFEIAASDVREDDEKFEAEASAEDTKEIDVDPLAIGYSYESSRGGIPDLEDTI